MKHVHTFGLLGLGMIALTALAQPGVAATPKAKHMEPPKYHAAITAMPACYSEPERGLVICSEKFSDGSSTVGVPVKIVGANGMVLLEGALDSRGEIEFKAPVSDYTITFADGAGSVVKSGDVHTLIYY